MYVLFTYKNCVTLHIDAIFFCTGLLDGIQKYFGIENNNSAAGLLQTVFICSYMVLAPIFGYMGDRYKRKYIMAAGILVWSGTVFASTLLNKDVSTFINYSQTPILSSHPHGNGKWLLNRGS